MKVEAFAVAGGSAPVLDCSLIDEPAVGFESTAVNIDARVGIVSSAACFEGICITQSGYLDQVVANWIPANLLLHRPTAGEVLRLPCAVLHHNIIGGAAWKQIPIFSRCIENITRPQAIEWP